MAPLAQAAVSVATILPIGCALIIAHELGHYGAARTLGVTATRFAIGFGPKLLRRVDRHSTEWSLALVPAGGYVSFAGEHAAKQAVCYAAQPTLARMLIIAASPTTNLIVAFLVFGGMLAIQGKPASLPVITAIVDHSAAQAVGFRMGARILAVDAKPVVLFDELRPIFRPSGDENLDFRILRGSTHIDLRPKLGTIAADGVTIGVLGVQTKTPVFIPLSVGQAAIDAATKTWSTMADTVNGASKAVTKGRGTENFAGVIGVTQLAGQAAVVGDSSIFSLIAILSGNLALLNLLPIPVLDGGALLFCAAAWFRGPTHIHEDAGSCYPHRTHRDSRALHAVIDARSGPIAEKTYEKRTRLIGRARSTKHRFVS